MRPCGGITPEMINYANSVDVYKLYADMVTYDHATIPLDGQHFYCAFASRRNGRSYVHSHQAVLNEFGGALTQYAPVPDALSSAMGNYMYMGRFDSMESVEYFTKFTLGEGPFEW